MPNTEQSSVIRPVITAYQPHYPIQVEVPVISVQQPQRQPRSRYINETELRLPLRARNFLSRRFSCLFTFIDSIAYRVEQGIYLSDRNNRYFNNLSKKYNCTQHSTNAVNSVDQFAERLIEENKISYEELSELNYICPISNRVIENAFVIMQDGNNYYFEKSCICDWLGRSRTNPMTREPVTRKQVKDAPEFSKQIIDYLKSKDISPRVTPSDSFGSSTG